SILLPTRKRPKKLEAMISSLKATCSVFPEVVVYIDDDDIESAEKAKTLDIKYIIGPKLVFSDYWNKCYEQCVGDILMMAADDVIFKTPGWDVMVEEEFAKWPDKIVLVHGDDLDTNFRSRFGTHSLLHRKWIEALGYFIPPYFSSDNGDRWLMAVADFLGRRKYLPFITEHMHPRAGKASLDSTYKERLIRHEKDNPNQLYNE